MSRAFMPAAMPAEIAELATDQGKIFDAASYLDDAWDRLVDKLLQGERVGRCDLHDLIDCELNGDRYRLFLDEIASVLSSSADQSRDELADKVRDGLIERYLTSNPDLVEEEATEMHYAEEEERRCL